MTNSKPVKRSSRIRRLLATAGIVLASGAALFPATEAHAVPDTPTGNMPWLVVRCKAKDDTTSSTAFQDNYVNDVFFGRSGISEYWNTVSYGKVNLQGTAITAVTTLSETKSQLQAGGRLHEWEMCAKGALVYGLPIQNYYGVVALYNAQLDLGSVDRRTETWNGVTHTYGTVVADVLSLSVGPLIHEMGHGMGLGHSYGGSPSAVAAGNAVEYGDSYDVMSNMRTYDIKPSTCCNLQVVKPSNASNVPTSGGVLYDPAQTGEDSGFVPTAGPGLDIESARQLGWVDSSRVLSGAGSGTVDLAAVNAPSAVGYLETTKTVQDTSTGRMRTFTFEFRNRTGWDSGDPSPAVVIHEIQQGGYPTLYNCLTCNGGKQQYTSDGTPVLIYSGHADNGWHVGDLFHPTNTNFVAAISSMSTYSASVDFSTSGAQAAPSGCGTGVWSSTETVTSCDASQPWSELILQRIDSGVWQQRATSYGPWSSRPLLWDNVPTHVTETYRVCGIDGPGHWNCTSSWNATT